MDFTLDFSHLYATVARSLSIIGKRSTDDKGNRIFADITLGSREQAIAYDFFTTAVIDLCTELSKFMTAEVRNFPAFAQTVYTDFWSTESPASLAPLITASGQLLYNPDTNKLHTSSITYPFSAINPDTDSLFAYSDNFYKWNGNQLTQLDVEDTAALSPEQMESATEISSFNTDPESEQASQPGIYLYYNNAVYCSSRSASFSQGEALPAGSVVVDLQGRAYVRQSNTLVNVPAGAQESVTISIDVPANWNTALEPSLLQALKNYCVAYALYSWFVITAPRIAEKHLLDAKNMIAAVIRLAHEKTPPKEVLPFKYPTASTTDYPT